MFSLIPWEVGSLVRKSKTPHTRLNAEHVVVDGVHVEDGAGAESETTEGDLGVVDTGEVAGTCGLVLLGLEGEGVGVDAGVGVAAVVHEGLNLVVVLAVLLLHAVLAVEDEAEGTGIAERANRLLVERLVGSGGSEQRHTGDIGDGSADIESAIDRKIGSIGALCHVPQLFGSRGGIRGHAPHELLDGVIVRKTDLGAGASDRVNTRVLDLLDEVLVTLLGEAATLLRVEVHVVTPHLGAGAEESAVL